jgi:CheY-like chemotaxis protein
MKTKREMNTAICAAVWTPPVATGQTTKHASIGIGVQHTLVSRCSGGEARILRGMAKRATASARARAVPEKALVSVVDDDESVRESLPDLLRELGFAAQAFVSAEEFLTSRYVAPTRCLILDIAMPGMSGPELQQELTRRGHDKKIIFITARSDETVRRHLLAQGAVDCLFKPFSEQELKAALDAALPGK